MLDIAYVALLDFFVRTKRILAATQTRSSRDRAVKPAETPERVGGSEAARLDDPALNNRQAARRRRWLRL
jgi:hypothetical protein